MTRSRSLGSLSVLALVISLAACSAGGGGTSVVATSAGPLDRAFTQSAAHAGGPRDLLVAIAQVEGGLDMPATRVVDVDNGVPVAGPLQLRRGKLDTLARGAALLGVSELELRRDTALGLEAGALVLAELGAQTGARADDLASWRAAIEDMSGYADAYHRAEYARRVYDVLAKGGAFVGRADERLTIAPHARDLGDIEVIVPSLRPLKGDADYGPADWFPTSCTDKCTPGRAGNPIEYVVIHDTEGGWDASVATLQNDPGKSVQYIVGTDGRVGQFIHEADTAWHAGNFYYNQRSVGIEHVGYSTKPYTEAQYAASATLVAYLTEKYKIAKDRNHIIGHDQIPNGTLIAESSPPCEDSPKSCESSSNYGGSGNHRDPGVWEWCTYMPRFGGTCKCNDIWALWNCSDDHTKAFRCNAGKVELMVCDGPGGCETKPLGTDDVCHTAPPDAGPKDAGAGDAGSDGGASDAGAKDAGASSSDAESVDGGGDEAGIDGGGGTDGSGGCAMGGDTRSSTGYALAIAAIALACARRDHRKGKRAGDQRRSLGNDGNNPG
jgi:hypothetical protein